jgi:predicted metal-dependent hydrolase
MAKMILPRSPDLDLDASIPRHWFGGNALGTHIVNGVNLLFPAGERFFVRSVRRYLGSIADDPELTAQVKGFFGQEGRHAGAHERFFDVLTAQGYDVERFLRGYEFVAYKIIEPVAPPSLRLSVTVALEHFTAILAENTLRDGLLEHAHPSLQKLLSWHAAEEIEHKAVAFDVLRKVHPSYALRMAGLAMATILLGGFWIIAVVMLLWQDPRASGARARREIGQLGERRSILRRVFLRGIREYIRRDFHPSQNDTDPLAEAYLASAGLT